MDIPSTLDTGLSLLSVALLTPDRVEGLATVALVEGIDTPRIRQLAGGSFVQDGDIREMLVAELAKRGIEPPSRSEAARHMAKAISAEILDKRADPFEAARYFALISVPVESGGSA